MSRPDQLAVAITLLVGTVLLGVSLSQEPGDPLFYGLTLVLAAVWSGGALLSGPVSLGRTRRSDGRRVRPVLTPVLVGLAAVAVFAVGGLVTAQVPALHDLVDGVLEHARQGSLPLVLAVTVVNGIAEELFFRGALYAALQRWHPVATSTVVYTVVTAATGNVMLVFAAAVLGTLTGLLRRSSGGVLAPVLVHVIWSTGMLLVLPPIMGAGS